MEPILITVGVNVTVYELDNSRLEQDVLYGITVAALNMNGHGPESNIIHYTRIGTNSAGINNDNKPIRIIMSL